MVFFIFISTCTPSARHPPNDSALVSLFLFFHCHFASILQGMFAVPAKHKAIIYSYLHRLYFLLLLPSLLPLHLCAEKAHHHRPGRTRLAGGEQRTQLLSIQCCTSPTTMSLALLRHQHFQHKRSKICPSIVFVCPSLSSPLHQTQG